MSYETNTNHKWVLTPRELDVARAFLKQAQRTKYPNYKEGSTYSWKHVAEAWAKKKYVEHQYISEVAFVQACREGGVTLTNVRGTDPNGDTGFHVNLSTKTAKATRV